MCPAAEVEVVSRMSIYQVVARNFSSANENKIHNDEIAKKYGFRGALVPGVAVYGHLTHPLVSGFGEQWLSHSVSSVRFLKPAYHDDRLTITPSEKESESDDDYALQCTNTEGELLAEMHSSMPGHLPDPEDSAVFDAPCKNPERVDMTWDNTVEGQPYRPWHVQITSDTNRTYAEQIADEQELYRHLAHPHWLLGIANRALTREYVMPAWIHVASEIRMRELVRVGDTLEIRAVPLAKWERKGHQFVRLYLAYSRDEVLTTEIFHTAIFRVAE